MADVERFRDSKHTKLQADDKNREAAENRCDQYLEPAKREGDQDLDCSS
jgi:hypothetical protein